MQSMSPHHAPRAALVAALTLASTAIAAYDLVLLALRLA